MPSLTSTYFRFYNADSFHNSIFSGNNNIYLFIGRSYPWSDEDNPPVANDSIKQTSYDYWSEVMSCKKIKPNDVSYVIRTVNWSTNIIYDQYTDRDPNWANNTFYVINENLDVYKCLSNNNDAPSTAEPLTVSNTNFSTVDGYRWKYMYSITASQALKFFSPDWMPVQYLTADDGSDHWDVQQTAANGSILHVQPTAGGGGYTAYSGNVVSGNSTHIVVDGSASGTDNIYNSSAMYIATGAGSGQVKEIVDYDGTTKTVVLATSLSTLANSTSTFSIAPMVNVVARSVGSGWVGYTNVESTAVTKINTLQGGNYYSNTEVVFSANAGTGATGDAYLAPPGGHGFNAVRELGGHNVMCAVKLSGSESNTFTTTNEYRRVGLIANPLLANGSPAISDSYDLTTILGLSAVVGTFNDDEVVVGQTSGATGRIVDIMGTDMRIIDIKNTFSVSETIQGTDSLATATVDAVTTSDVAHYTGELLYLENRTNIPRDPNQLEDYRVVVIF